MITSKLFQVGHLLKLKVSPIGTKIALIYYLLKGFSGTHRQNCIPLYKWLDGGTNRIDFEFISDIYNQKSGVDVTARCMPNEYVPMGYTWDQRRNAFNLNDDCYECGPCPNESDVCTSGERAFTCLARCHAGYSYIDAEARCTCSGTDCIVNGKCFEL